MKIYSEFKKTDDAAMAITPVTVVEEPAAVAE
jgi:hypothetical protein